MSKHTPGPWQYRRLTLSDTVSFTIDSQNADVEICEVHSWANSVAQTEANVRLIAAAPEMFAALKGIAKEELLREHEGSPRYRAVATKRIKAVQAAIAKAEGRK